MGICDFQFSGLRIYYTITGALLLHNVQISVIGKLDMKTSNHLLVVFGLLVESVQR